MSSCKYCFVFISHRKLISIISKCYSLFYSVMYWQELANILPKDTLIWKLKLLKSAAAYANSQLHAVKAEVLVLARFSFF